jgi:DNA-binding response OmpR family regulator
MRLLLVEDDVLLRDSLRRALQAAGYAVDACGDGVVAGTSRPRSSLTNWWCSISACHCAAGLDVLRDWRAKWHHGAGAGAHRARRLVRAG